MKDNIIIEIEHYFNRLIIKYNFQIVCMTRHIYQLNNDYLIVNISWERHFEDFQISFVNLKSNNKYAIGQVLIEKKLIGKQLLYENEREYRKKLNTQFQKDLYTFSIVVERYCSDILRGDFSIMESSS